ncbi:MAG: VOC family protein [Chloroflexi bacterium]|nr:VOC family protein [Chloroflexota bacterium]
MNVDAQITFIYTDDLPRSARFYEEVLGFELALDQGSCRIYRVVGGKAYIGICSGASPPDAGAGIILTLVTADVDGWYNRIIATGWECEHPPRRNDAFDIYHFFLRDPSGYRIEIQRFASEDWDRSTQGISL